MYVRSLFVDRNLMEQDWIESISDISMFRHSSAQVPKLADEKGNHCALESLLHSSRVRRSLRVVDSLWKSVLKVLEQA